jgi:hypothetical protein
LYPAMPEIAVSAGFAVWFTIASFTGTMIFISYKK